jgi:L-asparaginase
MSDTGRRAIADACLASSKSRIVITHGTDTMVETALVLADALVDGPHEGGHYRKTVVLTGAMVPYAFGSSDGLFNLGSALSFAQTLAPGVYIAMNGRAFAWNDVRKNRESGVFENL